MKYDVIVVGAGLAGLSCAYELAAAKRRVLLLEAHPYVGGRTSSFNDRGMAVESGLHRYIGYYSALPSLLMKCGVDISDIVTWEEKADVIIKGENKKAVLGVAPLYGFKKAVRSVFGNADILTAGDKASLLPFFVGGFADYLMNSSLDSYSVAEYANKFGVSERAKRVILEPLSSGIFFMPPENYSAYAFFGLFAPAIPKFYKMRIGAYLGGMSEVMCNPIAKKIRGLGGDIRLGERVAKVISGNGAVRGVLTEGGREFRAPSTVVACALPGAKKLLAPLGVQGELWKIRELPCMSACTCQMELDRPALKKDVTTFAPGTDLVSFAEQSRSTFRGTRGRLSVIMGNPDEYAKMSGEEIVGYVVRELEALGVHVDGHVISSRKVAEENEFYSLAPGNQALRPSQVSGVPGLYLAGDYTMTSSFATMEGAVISGKKAARAICRFLAGKGERYAAF